MVRALSFDERLYLEIAGDSTAIIQSGTIVFLGAVAHVVGLEAADPRCFIVFITQRLVWWFLISLLIFFVGYKILPPLASDYGANSPVPDPIKIGRVLGFAMTPRLFLIAASVPMIGVVIRIIVVPFWWIGLMIIAVRGLFGYNEVTRSALVVVIGFVPLMLIEPFIFSVGSTGVC